MSRTTLPLGAALVAALALPTAAHAAAPDGAGPWMDAVTASRQGALLSGGTIAASRSTPESTLGVAEDTQVEGTFFSLGFGGTVTLRSDAPICDGPGADLRIIEATNVGSENRERARIEVSPDGVSYTTLSTSLFRSGDVSLPAGSGASYYVRITDVSSPTEFRRAGADGYDVDGVSALNAATCGPVVPNPPPVPSDPTPTPTPTPGPSGGGPSGTGSSGPGGTGGTQAGGTPTTTGTTATPTTLVATNAASLSLTGTPTAAAGQNASEQLLACSASRLLVEDVRRSGRKVLVLGVADSTLLGRSVEVKLVGGASLGRATVGQDGSFRLVSRTLPLATGKLDAARLVARLGAITSPAVKVGRRLQTQAITLRARTLRWKGRVSRPLPRRRATILLTRRSGCGGYTTVARARVRADGTFTLSYRTPASGSGVFRLRTAVPATARNPKLFGTFSLVRGFDFGA